MTTALLLSVMSAPGLFATELHFGRCFSKRATRAVFQEARSNRGLARDGPDNGPRRLAGSCCTHVRQPWQANGIEAFNLVSRAQSVISHPSSPFQSVFSCHFPSAPARMKSEQFQNIGDFVSINKEWALASVGV
jgi:hypothetical protein